MKLKLFVASAIVSSMVNTGYAQLHACPDQDKCGTPSVLSAKDARNIIVDELYNRHSDAINWWVEFINAKIEKESRNGSACTSIDVTVASIEVQNYLVGVYDRAGYYQTELVPGWTGEDIHHRGGHPDGKTYLNLSW